MQNYWNNNTYFEKKLWAYYMLPPYSSQFLYSDSINLRISAMTNEATWHPRRKELPCGACPTYIQRLLLCLGQLGLLIFICFENGSRIIVYASKWCRHHCLLILFYGALQTEYEDELKATSLATTIATLTNLMKEVPCRGQVAWPHTYAHHLKNRRLNQAA
jgi:hypothetical protein